MHRLTYLRALMAHKLYVLIAGMRLGGIGLVRLLTHDLSKFTRAEFGPYADHFYGDPIPDTRGGAKAERARRSAFTYAWIHHYKANPHHWNYWIHNGDPVVMPERYAREMVADWAGAGRAYTGSWDMGKWLRGNWTRIELHKITRIYVRSILVDMGYARVLGAAEREAARLEKQRRKLPRAGIRLQFAIAEQHLPAWVADDVQRVLDDLGTLWNIVDLDLLPDRPVDEDDPVAL